MDVNQAGFGHMFPYANIHELNIDWVLTTVKDLEARTEQIEENIRQIFNTLDDHEQRLVALKQELTELRAAFEEFKVEINARMDNFEAEIRERMTLFEETINNRLTAFESEVRQMIADFEQRVDDRMTQFENSINTKFEQLEQSINTQFDNLEHSFNDRFTALESELRLEIQNNLKYLVDTCAEFTARVVTLEGRVSQIEADMQECCTTITGKLDEVIAELEKLNPSLVEKLITANGTYNALDEGATGFYRVVVDVPNAVLRSVEFTTNGTYTPPTGVDGYNEVIVNLAMQEKTVTQNGEVTPDAGYEGLSKVIVDTPSVVNNQDKTIDVNGSYTADAGYTGLGTVTVDVPAPAPVIAPLTVTDNGTYNAPAGTDGYSPVTVDVPLSAKLMNRTIKHVGLSFTNNSVTTFTSATEILFQKSNVFRYGRVARYATDDVILIPVIFISCIANASSAITVELLGNQSLTVSSATGGEPYIEWHDPSSPYLEPFSATIPALMKVPYDATYQTHLSYFNNPPYIFLPKNQQASVSLAEDTGSNFVVRTSGGVSSSKQVQFMTGFVVITLK